MTKANRLIHVVLLGVALLLSQGAFALEQKGVAQVDYKRSFKRDDRRAAIDEALRNAIETWVANSAEDEYENYERVKDQINADIRNYILSHTVIDEEDDRKNRSYRVVVRAEINRPRLNAILRTPSAEAARGNNEVVTFMFVARQQVGIVNQSSKTATQSKERKRSIGRERSDQQSTQSKTQTQTISMDQSDAALDPSILWDVATSGELEAAMGEVFTDNRYRYRPSAMVGLATGTTLNIEDFVEDYRRGNDIKPPTRREAMVRLLKLQGTADAVEYLAMGTLDVESTRVDESTGNFVVVVAVTGEVLSVRDSGVVVAKVAAETVKGEGITELMARNNALNTAAQKAARDLVAKLTSRNIR